MNNWLLSLIILAPAVSSLLLGVLYLYSLNIKKIPNSVFTLFALSSITISFAIAVGFFIDLSSAEEFFVFEPYKWLGVNGYNIYMGFLGDRLSIFMVLFITFIGLLIHIYAVGYMQNDEGYGKFFAYFNLFMASMLLLVLGNSPIIMFIGWEGVGLCSYLLISFYFTEPMNVVAGNKAFIVNRVGDFGFIIGLTTLFFYGGQAGFDYFSIKEGVGSVDSSVLTFIGVALFIGAMGKSAQIPLYVWLPDAMAGPTPVSALIHAATMVTAGVYMVARFHFLYDLIPNVGLFIAYIGAFSALFAAIIATKQSDIKKILAYSTMSQLGYMFIAVGLGFYSSGLFHVFTHAFFKALLFMGAGAVIVALHHEQNIFKMGGLKSELPLVFAVMLIANLAISGIFPFSGFFSKDEILLKAFASENYLIYAIGMVTAGLTSYYMFRLFFVVFYGKNYKKHHINSIPMSMKVPLVILAIGATFSGFLGLPEVFGKNLIDIWLEGYGSKALHVSHSLEYTLMGVSLLAAFIGIVAAYRLFYSYDLSKEYKGEGLIYNKFYIDEIYDFLIVKRVRDLSTFISYKIDDTFIDGIVMGLSHGFIKLGKIVGIALQSANTRLYAFYMLLGVSMFSIYLILIAG